MTQQAASAAVQRSVIVQTPIEHADRGVLLDLYANAIDS
jgi:hypothetical protein